MRRIDDTMEVVSCNICGDDAYTVVYEAKYDQRKYEDIAAGFRSSGDETLIDQVVQCNTCGLIYVNPRLRPEVILDAYAEGSDEAFVSQNRGRERTFEKCLDIIENHHPGAGGNRILDIGTAGGAFLHVAKQRGWEVSGCEPNRWLCDWCRENYGIDIQPGSLFEQDYPDNAFDVISLWDVLEHTSDPGKVLLESHRILAPGGHLVVNYPDIGSWIAKSMGSKWVFLLSVHLYYFTRGTITRLLDGAGFDIVKIRPHYQRLALGYIFHRASAYIGGIASLGEKMARKTGLSNLLIPYWMGQTLVIARKKGQG